MKTGVLKSPVDSFDLTSTNHRVLVVGGGVSGCAAAIRLRHLGFDVTLMERARFPREKICGCCLGAAGVTALDALGLGDGVRRLGVPTHTFVGYLQTARPSNDSQANTDGICRPPVRLPIVPGVAISRSVLDTYLLEQAKRAGVDVLQPHEAQVLRSDSTSVTVRHRPRVEQANQVSADRESNATANSGNGSWTTTTEYSSVILATGLTGPFQGRIDPELQGDVPAENSSDDTCQTSPTRWDLPWIEPPHGPLGIAAHVPGDHPLAAAWPIRDGEIQMVCGDDGYVGMVRMPNGAIDIAAALRSRDKGKPSSMVQRSPVDRVVRLLLSHPDLNGHSERKSHPGQNWQSWLQHDAIWMSAPPLRRQRQAGQGRVVAIGDCARYVEPLTGEGMTWGIESGIAVADLLRRMGGTGQLSSKVDDANGEDFARLWQRQLPAIQTKRRVICGLVTAALRYRNFRRLTRVGLSYAGWIARPLTWGVAGGPHFESTSDPPDG